MSVRSIPIKERTMNAMNSAAAGEKTDLKKMRALSDLLVNLVRAKTYGHPAFAGISTALEEARLSADHKEELYIAHGRNTSHEHEGKERKTVPVQFNVTETMTEALEEQDKLAEKLKS